MFFGGGLTAESSSEEESEDDVGGGGFFWAGLLAERVLASAGVEEGVFGADFCVAVFFRGSCSSLLLLESVEETLLIWDFLVLTVRSTGSKFFLRGSSALSGTVGFLSFFLFFSFLFSALFSGDFAAVVLLELDFWTFSTTCSRIFFLFFFLKSALTPFSSGPSSSVGLLLFLQLSLISSK